jgi:hypothetical protein
MRGLGGLFHWPMIMWANLVIRGNILIINFRPAVFSYGPRIRTDFIQDKNVVDCLACSLSSVQHSRYWLLLFDVND